MSHFARLLCSLRRRLPAHLKAESRVFFFPGVNGMNTRKLIAGTVSVALLLAILRRPIALAVDSQEFMHSATAPFSWLGWLLFGTEAWEPGNTDVAVAGGMVGIFLFVVTLLFLGALILDVLKRLWDWANTEG